jgi:hypothetical protein
MTKRCKDRRRRPQGAATILIIVNSAAQVNGANPFGLLARALHAGWRAAIRDRGGGQLRGVRSRCITLEFYSGDRGAGGYEPGRLTHDETQTLITADVETLQNMLRTDEFWALPSHVEESGMDGAQWILEVREGTRYHYIDRWCPQDGVANDVGRILLSIGRRHSQ